MNLNYVEVYKVKLKFSRPIHYNAQFHSLETGEISYVYKHVLPACLLLKNKWILFGGFSRGAQRLVYPLPKTGPLL